MTSNDVIEAARGWLGTPWHHQGRLKGVGVDCVGLIVCVCRELGIKVDDVTDYQRFPDGVKLAAELERQLIKTNDLLAGTVILFRVSRLPQHIGICSPIGIIHAHMGSKVVETTLSQTWRSRIVGMYRLPGVN